MQPKKTIFSNYEIFLIFFSFEKAINTSYFYIKIKIYV